MDGMVFYRQELYGQSRPDLWWCSLRVQVPRSIDAAVAFIGADYAAPSEVWCRVALLDAV